MIKSILVICLAVMSIALYAQPGCHDPSTVVPNNGRFWMYSTGNGISVFSSISKEFTTWRSESAVFPGATFPSWITTYVPDFGGHFWAPDIFYMNNKWHLYYSCSTFGSRNSAIGLATSSSLSNPVWEDRGMVAFTNSSMNHNAIDPAIYRDYNGKVWMLYGSYWNGLVVTELDTLSGKPVNRNNITFVANNGCEAGAVTKENGYYYLFFNRGSCCSGINSTYHILVGRSTSPTGPFLDNNGVNCNQNGGTSFLRSDGRFVGPGHFSRIDSIFSYHFYDANANGASRMKTAKLRWKDGWPVAEYQSVGALKDGIYTIKNRNSQKVIGLNNANTANGTSILQYADDGRLSNLWRFSYNTEGKFYRITPYTAPDKLLEIRECGLANGNKAIIWSDTGYPCQEWYISMTTQGYHRIANLNSHLMLEIINAFTNDGAEAQQWPYNEHHTQQWIVTEYFPTDVKRISDEQKIQIFYDRQHESIRVSSSRQLDGAQLNVFNTSGSLMSSHTLTNFDEELKLSSLLKSGGLYLFRIVDSNGHLIALQKILL
jgi:arabinan endo-1,5-alpha-L-arabinosidase